MLAKSFETTTKKVQRTFLTLGHTLYLRELWQSYMLQRQGILMPLSDWVLLLDILDYLIEAGVLVAYLDDEEIGIVARNLWLSDVAADPQLKELRINKLPRDDSVLLGVMITL